MLPEKIRKQRQLLRQSLDSLEMIEQLDSARPELFASLGLDVAAKQRREIEIVNYAEAIIELMKLLHEEVTGNNAIPMSNMTIAELLN